MHNPSVLSQIFFVYTLHGQVSKGHQPREEYSIFGNENLSYFLAKTYKTLSHTFLKDTILDQGAGESSSLVYIFLSLKFPRIGQRSRPRPLFAVTS